MKKNSLVLLAGLALLLWNNQQAIAGCGGPFILSNPGFNRYPAAHETLYLTQGESIILYGGFDNAEHCMLLWGPDVDLIWFKDGIAFEPVSSYSSYGNESILVTEPGIYTIGFAPPLGSAVSNDYNGRIEIIESIPIHQSTPPATNIDQEPKKKNLSIYPNPTSEGYFYIDYPNDLNINNIEIYSIGGGKILSIVPNGSEMIAISVSDFKPGLYIVKIDSAAGLIIERIMVK